MGPVICLGPFTELEKVDGAIFGYGQLVMKWPAYSQLKHIFGLLT
jgi:hypothetical protein